MNDPVDSNVRESDRPSYLVSLDDALACRHELADTIVAAFRSSQEPLPVAVSKQIAALKQCSDAENFLSSSLVASMLPLVLYFRTSESTRFVSLLSSYIAVHTKKRTRFVRFWTYPLILTVLLIALLFGQAWIISPVFEDMFSDFELRLPPPTKLLFWVNRNIREYLMIAIVLILLIFPTVVFLKRLLGEFAERYQHWGAVLWLTRGTYANLIAMHHFVGSLAASLEMGMPLSDALPLAGDASQRSYYRESAESLDHSLGGTASMRVLERFPAMFQHVMQSSVGVPEMVRALYGLSEVYRDRALLRKQSSLSAVQPFVILAIGALIGFITVTLFMPLFSLVTALS